MLGRGFEAAETRPNGPQVAVLSYETWQSAFGGRPEIVGSQVEINGIRRTVVGVMPHISTSPTTTSSCGSRSHQPGNRQNRGSHFLLIGVSRRRATPASARGDRYAARGPASRLWLRRPAPTSGRTRRTPGTTRDSLRRCSCRSSAAPRPRFVLQGAVVFVPADRVREPGQPALRAPSRGTRSSRCARRSVRDARGSCGSSWSKAPLVASRARRWTGSRRARRARADRRLSRQPAAIGRRHHRRRRARVHPRHRAADRAVFGLAPLLHSLPTRPRWR